MPARSLYVAFDVYPRPKGSSSHILSMIQALAIDFAPVTVLCLGDSELPAFTEAGGGIQIHRFHDRTQNDLLSRATAFAQFVTAYAAREARTLELLVFRDPWGGVPAMRALPGVPGIFEVNALPSWELAYSRPGFMESATLTAKLGDMERACLRGATSILTVSAVTKSALQAAGIEASRIEAIPNSADESLFDGNTACPIPALEDPGLDWFGYIGGLQPWQGVDHLLEAYGLIAAECPRSRFLILHSGNHDTRPLLRQVARLGLESQVLLQNPLPAEVLGGIFRRLRFSVAPLSDTSRNTYQGCCPVKIIDSMAAGTPVLASDLAVARELIRHDADGWLAPAGDRREWGAALLRLLRDERLRRRLAEEAIRTARLKFSRAFAHERLRTVFRRVAAKEDLVGLCQ